ncbi:Ff.00g087030.m01.CDS01 [Fusarium sp. VM40]|nr:Ff.00g087030.m01.CDS01 [Fusarium sp. VM40]
MRFSLPVVLLAGLGLAADPSVWDFDDSCQTPERLDRFKKAYNDAELMAVKAQGDMRIMNTARPDFERMDSPGLRNWDRIARAVTNMFGFAPSKDGHDPNEEHFSNVMYVYDRMVKTLHDGQLVPENGYGGFKPLLMCDEKKWVWVGKDEKDPHDPRGRPLRESQARIVAGYNGAWVYKHRYLAAVTKQDTPGLCRDGVWATTLTRYDFIIFCDASFGDKTANTKSAVDAKDTAAKGDKLNSYSSLSLARIMVHEFAHWFGGDKTGGPDNRDVKDQPAVGKEGAPIYRADNKYTTDANAPGAKRVITYDFLWTSNLARSHLGENEGNTGPSKSTFTAESYALFSVMTYMDNWDWSGDGIAKDFSMIPYKQLPNGKKFRLEG